VAKGRSRRAIRMSPDELLNVQARISGALTATQMRDAPVEKVQGKQKFGNEKVKDGDMVFDSKAEHRRWPHLKIRQRLGEISDLQRQVPFELIPRLEKPSGGHERPTVYLADYTYRENGELVVEDVKGAVTPEFRLKRKLMLFRHGIEIREIRA